MSERKCIVTRETKPLEDLLRFVVGPDDQVVPDLKRTLPGRGVWVTAKAKYVEDAVGKGLFARAFKMSVKSDDSLSELITSLLARQCLDYLSLARKAGLVSLGFTKVQQALKGDIAILVQAEDAALDGKRKLMATAKSNVKMIECFTIDQLSLALGRPNVVHAGVRSHGLTEKLIFAVRRYNDYVS